MFTTDRFRFLVFTSAFTVLFLASAVKAESDPPAGPQAPVFPPVEESSETPDLSGVEDSIQIDDLKDFEPAPPAVKSPVNESPVKETPEKNAPAEKIPDLKLPEEESPAPQTPDSLELDPLPEAADSPHVPGLDPAPASTPSLDPTPIPDPSQTTAPEESPASPLETLSDPNSPEFSKVLPPLESAQPKSSQDQAQGSRKSKEKSSLSNSDSSGKKDPKRLAQSSQTKSDDAREEISVSRRLLLKLSPPDSVLDGVEQVDLRTFLNAPALRDDVARTREALPYYWKAAELRSEVFYWANRLDAMKQLAENAGATDREVYNSAAAAAQASLNLAKLTLRSNAMKLANLAGYTREVTAKTLPHAGEYNTRYDEIMKNSAGNSQITYYHGLVTFHQEQLTAAASAYLTAESLLKQLRSSAPATAVLASWDVLNDRRKVFFEVLLNFNDDILNYALNTSNRRGPELAPLLVKPVSSPSKEGALVSPSLPTPPEKAPAPPAELPSVMQNSDQTAALPKAEAPIQTTDPETGQTYSENETIDISPGGSSKPDPYGSVQPLGNAPTNTAPAPPVPGYDLGAPPVETAPPGSDFIPIGGETGVSTSPILSAPSGNDGVWRLPRVRPGEQRVTLGKPSVLEEAGNSERENDFSLAYVLERSSFSDRERVIHEYWRYVMLQEQTFVLEHQKNLLSFISRRLLDSLSGNSAAAPLRPELGTVLELQALTLRVALVEMKVEKWKVLNQLAKQLSWKVEWPVNFPKAVTNLKTKGFSLGLDQNVSGSEKERRALPWARHFYFACDELLDSFDCVASLGDLLAGSGAGLETSKLGGRLKNASSDELTAILEAMTEARSVSWKYFQLLYDVNVAYSSCVLAGTQAGKEPGELAALLAN
ncbi:MAG: hypothetical protein K6C40_10695 [Thermoguttaceae bacterium]|nr:hypothetical protein [Thermoguttaceae bacterium]